MVKSSDQQVKNKVLTKAKRGPGRPKKQKSNLIKLSLNSILCLFLFFLKLYCCIEITGDLHCV